MREEGSSGDERGSMTGAMGQRQTEMRARHLHLACAVPGRRHWCRKVKLSQQLERLAEGHQRVWPQAVQVELLQALLAWRCWVHDCACQQLLLCALLRLRTAPGVR